MEKNIRMILSLCEIFGDDFYSYSVTKYSVFGVCKFNQRMLLKAINQHDFVLKVSASGSLWLSKDNVTISMVD